MSQIIASTTLDSLWTFMTSTTLKTIMLLRWVIQLIVIQLFLPSYAPPADVTCVARFVFFTGFVLVGFTILNQLGPDPLRDPAQLLAIGRQGLADIGDYTQVIIIIIIIIIIIMTIGATIVFRITIYPTQDSDFAVDSISEGVAEVPWFLDAAASLIKESV